MENDTKLSIRDYKQKLIETEQRLSEQLDKVMLTVSGGALALSLTFVKDFVGDKEMCAGELLISAWAFLIFCILFNLTGFHFGIKAYRKAQEQIEQESIDDETPGGIYSCLLNYVNIISISFICLGLIALFIFVYLNLN